MEAHRQMSKINATFALVAVALALVGCGETGKAKQVVGSLLKDPSSAQWRNIESGTGLGDSGPLVCGEVNGKNSFGAYDGFQKFIYKAKDGTARLRAEDGDFGGDKASVEYFNVAFDLEYSMGCVLN
jgi:hypothetical protein